MDAYSAKDEDDNGNGNGNGEDNDNDKKKKRKGPKRSKTEDLKIDVTINIQPDHISEGSIHKGFRDVIIQDIKFESFNPTIV